MLSTAVYRSRLRSVTDIGSGGAPLRISVVIFYAVMAAPILGLLALASSGSLRLVWSAGLASSLTETALLLAGAGLLTGSIGIGSAWLVGMYRFPGRDILAVLLVLPLALPTYLAAYIVVEVTDYFGPLQTSLRWLMGWTSRKDYWFPEIRSLPGAILVFSLVLYPYVYLPCKMMFERQGSSIIQSARLHGSTGFRLFHRVGLPLARPALASGLVFALLETLNDVGAVEHLGVQSLSLTIRSVWLNHGNLPGAAQIALFALVLVSFLLFVEFRFRRQAAFAGASRISSRAAPISLHGAKAWAAFAVCALPVTLGFLLPAVFLIAECSGYIARRGLESDLFSSLWNSVFLSTAAALLVALIGAVVALAARVLRSGFWRFGPHLATLGYAIPGTVLVIALLPVYGVIDSGLEMAGWRLVISGSQFAILGAYILRFSSIGAAQAETGLSRLSKNMDHAARTLGCSVNRLAFSILTPNIRQALGLAALLTFVDAMKELPATLLLRPLNMDTLATSLYAKASGGSFEEGALEAMLIMCIGVVPVILLARLKIPR